MRGLIKKFRTYFVAGMVVLLPIVLSTFIIFKLFQWLDNVFPSITGIELPSPGLGALVIIITILFTGIIAKNFIGKKIIELGNAIIASIPVLSKIFLVVQQIMDVMIKPQKNFFGEVVVVEYPKEDSWTLGFVTSKDTPEISESVGEKTICVYVPTTPNPTSGFMLYIPEYKVKKVNLSTEMAVKAIVSAGIVSSGRTDCTTTPERSLGEVLRKWKARKKSLIFDPRD